MTTTPNIDGKRITKSRGIVAKEAMLGANLFKDLFAGIRDLVGRGSATSERKTLGPTPSLAWISTTICLAGDGMLMVSASGTAVVFE